MDAILVTKNKLINADGINRFQEFCSFYSGNDTIRYDTIQRTTEEPP